MRSARTEVCTSQGIKDLVKPIPTMTEKELENAQEMKQAMKEEASRKWCNKCRKFLKVGGIMKNHRKGWF